MICLERKSLLLSVNPLNAGTYEITWLAEMRQDGIYYYTLTTAGNTVTKHGFAEINLQ